MEELGADGLRLLADFGTSSCWTELVIDFRTRLVGGWTPEEREDRLEGDDEEGLFCTGEET